MRLIRSFTNGLTIDSRIKYRETLRMHTSCVTTWDPRVNKQLALPDQDQGNQEHKGTQKEVKWNETARRWLCKKVKWTDQHWRSQVRKILNQSVRTVACFFHHHACSMHMGSDEPTKLRFCHWTLAEICLSLYVLDRFPFSFTAQRYEKMREKNQTCQHGRLSMLVSVSVNGNKTIITKETCKRNHAQKTFHSSEISERNE